MLSLAAGSYSTVQPPPTSEPGKGAKMINSQACRISFLQIPHDLFKRHSSQDAANSEFEGHEQV